MLDLCLVGMCRPATGPLPILLPLTSQLVRELNRRTNALPQSALADSEPLCHYRDICQWAAKGPQAECHTGLNSSEYIVYL